MYQSQNWHDIEEFRKKVKPAISLQTDAGLPSNKQ